MGDRGGRERRKEIKRGKERERNGGSEEEGCVPQIVTSSILYTTDPK